MKLKSIFFVVLFLCVSNIISDPLLVVVLMVKNEALVIKETLQPFVDGGVTDFVIFDTGSTDGTQKVAQEFFMQHDIANAHVVEEPFIDFSASRNHALEAAQSIFPQATFMLMPDAEWYMHGVEQLLKFCGEHVYDYHDSYLLSIRSTTLAFYVSRLIRCHKDIHFVGAVHECLNKATIATLPSETYFEWRPSQKGQDKSALRWKRDLGLLLKSYEQNPFDPRTLFYLAQTYECLSDLENAYIFYTKRIAIPGWDEENFMAQLRLGNIVEQIDAKNGNTSLFPDCVKEYLHAFVMRPQRAEPLIKIAQYFLDHNQMQLAFLFARRAAEIPYPVTDILFVEKYLYDFTRYDILGRCAWYVGEYELGEWAMRKALEVNPESEHLQRNLKFYTDRKASI